MASQKGHHLNDAPPFQLAWLTESQWGLVISALEGSDNPEARELARDLKTFVLPPS